MYQIHTLDRDDFVAAARDLNVSVEVVKAVASVEARGTGFISGTDLPIILFEGHHFHRFTGGRYDKDFPSISYPKWTQRFYKGKRGEYDRLLQAIKIHAPNPEPALLSTSWGMFQIMGFNYALAGYDSVIDFVNAMSTDEGAHLRAFTTFLRATKLDRPLRDQRWAAFAEGYNGKGFRKNDYDKKLAAAFAKERSRRQEEEGGGSVDPERSAAVALQVALNVALADKLPEKLTTDGWVGEKTTAAIRLFQNLNNLPDTGELTSEVKAALGLDDDDTPQQEAA